MPRQSAKVVAKVDASPGCRVLSSTTPPPVYEALRFQLEGSQSGGISPAGRGKTTTKAQSSPRKGRLPQPGTPEFQEMLPVTMKYQESREACIPGLNFMVVDEDAASPRMKRFRSPESEDDGNGSRSQVKAKRLLLSPATVPDASLMDEPSHGKRGQRLSGHESPKKGSVLQSPGKTWVKEATHRNGESSPRPRRAIKLTEKGLYNKELKSPRKDMPVLRSPIKALTREPSVVSISSSSGVENNVLMEHKRKTTFIAPKTPPRSSLRVRDTASLVDILSDSETQPTPSRKPKTTRASRMILLNDEGNDGSVDKVNVSSFIDNAATESDDAESPTRHGVSEEENSDDRAFINDAAVLTEESSDEEVVSKGKEKACRPSESLRPGTSTAAPDAGLSVVEKIPETLPYVQLWPHSRKESSMDLKTYIDSTLVVNDLQGTEKMNLVNALAFESHGCFINPACAPLSLVRMREGRLLIADTLETAVFFLTGLVEESYLRHPHESSYNQETTMIHRLELAPFGDEFRRSIAYIGNAFGVREMAGPIAGSHINLSTRKQGGRTNASPVKKPSVGAKYMSPSKTNRGSTTATSSYPPFLLFDEKVPIYNASEVGFAFDGTSLSKVKDLPPWRGCMDDLLPGSVVTAAFAAGSFESSVGTNAGWKLLAFMPNILFVIVLAVGTA